MTCVHDGVARGDVLRRERREDGQWPFVTTIGDSLRASVVCNDIDALDRAWASVRDGFKVCDGHGRLKNHLRTKEERPPDMLVQRRARRRGRAARDRGDPIHLREVLSLKEAAIHRMYELIRAKNIEALLEEGGVEKHARHEVEEERRHVVRRINAVLKPFGGLHGDADHKRNGPSAARDSTPADGSSARKGHFLPRRRRNSLGSPTPASETQKTRAPTWRPRDEVGDGRVSAA